MKYLAILLFALPFFSHSQSIDVFVGSTTTEISGSTHNVNSTTGQQFELILILRNSTGTDQNWDLERTLPLPLQHWSDDNMSWTVLSNPLSGDSYLIDQSSPWVTYNHLVVPPNDSVYLALRYDPIADGCDLFNYYILDNDVRVDSFSVNLCTTVGLDEITSDNISVYPNPANSVLNVSFQNKTPNELTIFDLLGNKIATFEASESMTISTGEILNGSYFLSWEIEEMNYNQKFQVQH